MEVLELFVQTEPHLVLRDIDCLFNGYSLVSGNSCKIMFLLCFVFKTQAMDIVWWLIWEQTIFRPSLWPAGPHSQGAGLVTSFYEFAESQSMQEHSHSLWMCMLRDKQSRWQRMNFCKSCVPILNMRAIVARDDLDARTLEQWLFYRWQYYSLLARFCARNWGRRFFDWFYWKPRKG